MSRNFTLEQLATTLPLPWSHYVLLSRHARSAEAFDFYHAEALRGGWSVRQLDRQISSLFYERTALSRNKTALLKQGAQPQVADLLGVEDAVRDPLYLEFLGLRDEYSEDDLEDALVRHLEAFLLELGNDFAFVGRQRRLRIGFSRAARLVDMMEAEGLVSPANHVGKREVLTRPDAGNV